MLFVTLHGGKPESNPHRNNIHAYDKAGNLITPKVLGDAGDLILDELRGMSLFGRYLYVVNANKDQNSVLCYEGAGTKFDFVCKFASQDSSNGISHPFDLTFGDAGYCYLSNQDSNVVTRLKVARNGRTSAPAALALALPRTGQFCPGTFVASGVGGLVPSTTAVPPPAGLEYAVHGVKKHSVRGVVWGQGVLYVADQPSGRVKTYDRDGRFLGQSNQVESPVHLLMRRGTLYVSGGDEVLTARLPSSPGNFQLAAIKGVNVKNISGMAFSKLGHFYAASRSEKKILKFDSDFMPMQFECRLPDDPEFLLHL